MQKESKTKWGRIPRIEPVSPRDEEATVPTASKTAPATKPAPIE